MEENKYYTPELSEFHYLFEFEIHNSKGRYFIPGMKEGWYTTYMDFGILGNIQNIQKLILDKQVRVPYLSKEDIEAEGFEFISNEFDGRIILRKNFILKNRGEEKITELLYIPTSNWCLIYIGDMETPTSDFTTIFAGTIKNKSELRRILKMIGV